MHRNLGYFTLVSSLAVATGVSRIGRANGVLQREIRGVRIRSVNISTGRVRLSAELFQLETTFSSQLL